LEGADASWLSPSLSITSFPFRVIRTRTANGVRFSAYDLASDPSETIDRYTALQGREPVIERLSSELIRYESRAEQLTQAAAAQTGLPLDRQPGSKMVDPLIEEKLRKLGYIH